MTTRQASNIGTPDDVTEGYGASVTITGCQSFDGIGSEPYGHLVMDNIEVKQSNYGGHFTIHICTEAKCLEATRIATLEAGYAVNRHHTPTPLDMNHIPYRAYNIFGDQDIEPAAQKEINRMNKLLGKYLLEMFIAEENKNEFKKKYLKIKTDALIMRIRAVQEESRISHSRP